VKLYKLSKAAGLNADHVIRILTQSKKLKKKDSLS